MRKEIKEILKKANIKAIFTTSEIVERIGYNPFALNKIEGLPQAFCVKDMYPEVSGFNLPINALVLEDDFKKIPLELQNFIILHEAGHFIEDDFGKNDLSQESLLAEIKADNIACKVCPEGRDYFIEYLGKVLKIVKEKPINFIYNNDVKNLSILHLKRRIENLIKMEV